MAGIVAATYGSKAMGLFDWLRPRPQIAISCWLDESSRMRGLVRAVRDDRSHRTRVLVVAHFADHLIAAAQALADAGTRVVTIDRWNDADTARLLDAAADTPLAVLAGRLPDIPEGRPTAPAGSGPKVVLRLCDLHVLAAENERVVRFARSLSAEVRASVSFDDPVMTAFAQPWVKTMMATMGLREDAPIDSPVVAKGLMRALRKLEGQATGNVPCTSQREWMARNLPSRA